MVFLEHCSHRRLALISPISAGGGSDQEAGEAGPEAAGGAATHRRGTPSGEPLAQEANAKDVWSLAIKVACLVTMDEVTTPLFMNICSDSSG